MKKQRIKHSAEFKARVALDAIRGVKTINEIAKEYEKHPVMVGNCKKKMLEHMPAIFEKKRAKKDKDTEQEKARFHQKVGELSIRCQCRLLHIHQSMVYYDLAGESLENLGLMKEIDQLHLVDSTAGTRRMH